MPVVMTAKPMVYGIDEGSAFHAGQSTSKRQSPWLAPRDVWTICGWFLQTGIGKIHMGELCPGHLGGADEWDNFMWFCLSSLTNNTIFFTKILEMLIPYCLSFCLCNTMDCNWGGCSSNGRAHRMPKDAYSCQNWCRKEYCHWYIGVALLIASQVRR